MSNPLKVGIIGAGIKGISNALFLQKKGFEVTGQRPYADEFKTPVITHQSGQPSDGRPR